jgi:hypothetical protein
MIPALPVLLVIRTRNPATPAPVGRPIPAVAKPVIVVPAIVPPLAIEMFMISAVAVMIGKKPVPVPVVVPLVKRRAVNRPALAKNVVLAQ